MANDNLFWTGDDDGMAVKYTDQDPQNPQTGGRALAHNNTVSINLGCTYFFNEQPGYEATYWKNLSTFMVLLIIIHRPN